MRNGNNLKRSRRRGRKLKNKTFFILYSVLLAALCIVGSALFVKCARERDKHEVKVTHTSDTIVVTKTDKVYVDRVQWLPGKIDTVFVFNGSDSLMVSGYARDTIWLERVELKLVTRDTIIHDTIIIDKVVEKGLSHWGLGMNAGINATWGVINRKFDIGPSFGFGVIYKF